MKIRIIPTLFVLLAAASGCSNIAIQNNTTATPQAFVTATLPVLEIPSPVSSPPRAVTAPAETVTAISPSPVTTSGSTTTQLNLRSEPSTSSEALGLIPQSAAVQVIGRDASTTWFLILEASGRTGWVRAEYVQVPDKTAIPTMGSVSGPGSGVSALVVEKVNIRSGPGTDFESLGVFAPNDVVFLTGKDAQGVWGQIEFPRTADGKGWATLKYLQVEKLEELPVIAAAQSTEPAPVESTALMLSDQDAAATPWAVVELSDMNTRMVQLTNQVSISAVDPEDWIQFTSAFRSVQLQIICDGGLQLEILLNGDVIQPASPACGTARMQITSPEQAFSLRLFTDQSTASEIVQYVVKIKAVP